MFSGVGRRRRAAHSETALWLTATDGQRRSRVGPWKLRGEEEPEPSHILATDAQAGPGSKQSGGGLAIDVTTGEERAVYIFFATTRPLTRGTSAVNTEQKGASSTAECKEAMPPSFMPDDLEWVSRRGMVVLIDNLSALSGLVKRQRRGAAAARAVQPVNMPRYHRS